MSYIIEIADSLTRILDRAASVPAHRVAGYCANAEFWLGEVRHCFNVLDGYDRRFRLMREATNAYVEVNPLDSQRQDASDTRTTRGTKDFEINSAREALATAARKFFNRCDSLSLLSINLRTEADSLINLEKVE